MGLTSVPLLVITTAATIIALVGTVWLWNRGGLWRVAIRTVSILTCEVLVAFTIGLAVNRSLDLFPSWAALLNNVPATAAAHTVGSGKLDHFIAEEEARYRTTDLAFPWHPADLSAWGLAGTPTVYVPTAYLRMPTRSFATVVVVGTAGAGPTQGAWRDQQVATLVRGTAIGATPAVVVFVRAAPGAKLAALGAALPDALAGDLRVSSNGWIMIGVGAQMSPALRVARSSGRYHGTALVLSGATTATAAPSTSLVAALRDVPLGYPALVVAGSLGDLGGRGVLGRIASAPRSGAMTRGTAGSALGTAGSALGTAGSAGTGAGGTVAAGGGTPGAGSTGSTGLADLAQSGAVGAATAPNPAGVSATPGTGGGAAPALAQPGGSVSMSVDLVSKPAQRLPAALRWAYELVPVPLAAPITTVPLVPVFKHPRPKQSCATTVTRTGVRTTTCAPPVIRTAQPYIPLKTSPTARKPAATASPTRSR